MSAFCVACGEQLNGQGDCEGCELGSQWQSEGPPSDVVATIGDDRAAGPGIATTAGERTSLAVRGSRVGLRRHTLDLPKASVGRRLLSSGVEYLFYLVAISALNLLGPITAGVAGYFGVPLLLAVVALRDTNSGGLSFGKRTAGLRVVNADDGQPISNQKALQRNSYYLVLILIMIAPFIKLFPSGLFTLCMLLDVMMILASRKGRRLGDLIAGTQVVQVKEG